VDHSQWYVANGAGRVEIAPEVHSRRGTLAVMIERVAKLRDLHDRDAEWVDYWRSRPPAERVGMVEALRREFYGYDDATEPRLPRVHRLLERA
jgi:hypothetical protein